MQLTDKEKEICKVYSMRIDGFVNCKQCPLVIDHHYVLCLANAQPEDEEDFREEIEAVRKKIEEAPATRGM